MSVNNPHTTQSPLPAIPDH